MKPYFNYQQKEDIQENAYHMLANWIDIALHANMEKDPRILCDALQSIYFFVNVRLKEGPREKVLDRLRSLRNELHTPPVTSLRQSEILDELYDLAIVFSQELHREGILYRFVVPPGEMSKHGTI